MDDRAAGAGAQKSILVIGAGLSGALAAWRIWERWDHSRPLKLTVWDGARGCGGRLSTARFEIDNEEGEFFANMGAQRLHTDGHAGADGVDARKAKVI